MAESRRQRTLGRAFRFAEEQGEEHFMAMAMRWIGRMESRIADRDSMELNEQIDSTRLDQRKSARSKTNYKNIVSKADETKRKPREDLSDLILALRHKTQKALRLHILLRGRAASFSMHCSRDNFLALVGGYANISGDVKLRAFITGKTNRELLYKYSDMLGLDEEEKNWVCRRYYGVDHQRTRDCSYISVRATEDRNNCIKVEWKAEKTKQVDRDGFVRETAFPKIIVKFPRKVTAVAPRK